MTVVQLRCWVPAVPLSDVNALCPSHPCRPSEAVPRPPSTPKRLEGQSSSAVPVSRASQETWRVLSPSLFLPPRPCRDNVLHSTSVSCSFGAFLLFFPSGWTEGLLGSRVSDFWPCLFLRVSREALLFSPFFCFGVFA